MSAAENSETMKYKSPCTTFVLLIVMSEEKIATADAAKNKVLTAASSSR